MSDQPRRIGPYRLVRKLGEGGMGVVHLARDDAFNLVALKADLRSLGRFENVVVAQS